MISITTCTYISVSAKWGVTHAVLSLLIHVQHALAIYITCIETVVNNVNCHSWGHLTDIIV